MRKVYGYPNPCIFSKKAALELPFICLIFTNTYWNFYLNIQTLNYFVEDCKILCYPKYYNILIGECIMVSKFLSNVANGVATNVSKEMTSNFLKKIAKHIKDEDIKYDIDSGEFFKDYIKNIKDKYEKVKTIINSNPLNLYNLYECVELGYNKKRIDTSCVEDVLNVNSKIIILGTAGIGKSMTMKHLLLKSIDISNYIPVFIELRQLNGLDINDFDLEYYICKVLNDMGLKIEYEHFLYSMEEGCYIILLDGFDELNSICLKKIESEVIRITDKYNLNKYIVSSRPKHQFTGWNDFVELKSLPLSKEKAISLVSKLPYDSLVKDKFSRELEIHLYDDYNSFASNPLLLTIMLITFDSNAKIPNSLNEFYEQAFYALFYRHDASKGSFVREKRSKLECEDFKKVFSYFCFKSFFETKFEFTESMLYDYLNKAKSKLDLEFNESDYIYDLTNSVCLLVKDGLNYKFAHRSFQEYFAAVYTVQLKDKDQTKLLKTWVSEDYEQCRATHYLDMLKDLEETRFFDNFIYNGLKIIYEKYISLNKNIYELTTQLITSISIYKENDEKDILVGVKDKYLFEIIIFISKNNENINSYMDVNLYKQILQICDSDQMNFITVDFNTLRQNNLDKKVIDSLWFKEYILFSLKVYEEHYYYDIGKKRKLSSILEEL